MRNKGLSVNIDNSDLVKYPNGRIKDNTGAGDGTPVNEFIYGDLHEFKDKLMRLASITPNGLPDNETNQYQLIEALRDFGSKHDVIQSITTASGILNVSMKLNTMQLNESLICKSSIDFTSETQIKGTDLNLFSLTVIGNFKTGEYVRLVKTNTGIILIRMIDAVNVDLAVGELLYLKKASQAQENTGTTDLVATTPLTNKTVFTRRVNGVDSSTYLATPSQNGLLSSADKIIIDSIGSSPIKNVGWIAGLDVGGTVGALPVSGDITSATASIPGSNESRVTINLNNSMDDLNYIVKMYLQSEGSLNLDNDVFWPVYKPISVNQFQIEIRESVAVIQSLKIHIEVVQL